MAVRRKPKVNWHKCAIEHIERIDVLVMENYVLRERVEKLETVLVTAAAVLNLRPKKRRRIVPDFEVHGR